MKRAYILSALLLTLTATMALPASTYASEATIQTFNQVPTEAQLAAKIAEIKAIEGYAEYVTLNPELLPYVTDYDKEYLYLFSLVNIAESMLENYEQTSPADLDMIMSAANDAIIVCNLKFGVTKRQSEEQQNTTISQTQQPQTTAPTPTSTTKTPVVAQTTTAAPSLPTTPSPTSVTSTDEPKSMTESQKEEVAVAPIEVPATSTPAPSETQKTGALNNHPLAFIIITASGLGIILALIISSRQKSYRPGRKA